MDSVFVEDFQNYHNHQPVGDVDEVLHSSPQARDQSTHSIDRRLEDDEDSLSGSAHHSSGPDEAVFDHPSRTSSPQTSNGSDDDISVLESHYEPEYRKPSPFTPNKSRPSFRNPSSVRAMQMDTTPPHLSSPSSQQRHRLYTPSRQHTPRSVRPHRNAMSSPSKLSPSKKLKKEYPLVLLHVTLLPIPLIYSQEIMESVLPPSILENWKTLQEKATDTVLERGILIPHPKEDYDLLEERLLESLELKTPRILKCGHFHLSPEEEADIAEADSEDEDDEEATDLDVCFDCGRRVRDGRYGSTGSGKKRWNIKLFAANGLMRAGAWSAAWREMERVDVEIVPWMEEDMKRELELRREEEERTRAPEAKEEGVGALDDERLREIYGGEAQAFIDGLVEETPATAEMAKRSTTGRKSKQPRREGEEVPLWDLLRDYILRMVQDRRNVAIFLLTVAVVFLSMGPFSAKPGVESMDYRHESDSTPQPSYSSPSPTSMVASHTAPDSITLASVPSTPSPHLQANPKLDPQMDEQQQTDSFMTESAEEELGEIIED